MHVVGESPLKEIVTKQAMQIAIILLSTLENKIGGSRNGKFEENKKLLNFELNDFKSGFERRVLMLASGAFLLNCPVDLLNGKMLQKLIEAG